MEVWGYVKGFFGDSREYLICKNGLEIGEPRDVADHFDLSDDALEPYAVELEKCQQRLNWFCSISCPIKNNVHDCYAEKLSKETVLIRILDHFS
jgi:hypothetical protein